MRPYQSKELLCNYASSHLTYISKSKGLFSPHDKYAYFKSQRLLVHSTMLGKIIAKYRLGLDANQNLLMPFNAKIYREYIDGVNFYLGPTFNYRQALQALNRHYQWMPQRLCEQPKQWMPSVWNLPKGQFIFQHIYQQILDDTMIQQWFDTQKIALILKNDAMFNQSLMMALYYLLRFKQLFGLYG